MLVRGAHGEDGPHHGRPDELRVGALLGQLDLFQLHPGRLRTQVMQLVGEASEVLVGPDLRRPSDGQVRQWRRD